MVDNRRESLDMTNLSTYAVEISELRTILNTANWISNYQYGDIAITMIEQYTPKREPATVNKKRMRKWKKKKNAKKRSSSGNEKKKR